MITTRVIGDQLYSSPFLSHLSHLSPPPPPIFIDPDRSSLSATRNTPPLGQEAQFPLATCPPSPPHPLCAAGEDAAKADARSLLASRGCGCCAAGLFVRAARGRGEARSLSRKYARLSSRGKRTRGLGRSEFAGKEISQTGKKALV